ncbi:RNA-directed DNA polymerase from mobile element jockey [Araneus ventricosus]|uniref:RNA-directed DNA polymerase from mobile element jockey n=1 Tax=Araneus ventricosus TaxID=182803 RepID=A0A4Y2DEV8_ARAVE|nr:RNA-directed DNA polymerase from mobile element jockey [Araneus ventricosus]
MHPSRVCEKTPICPSCGDIHSGIWQVPRKCINCQGEHSATSRGCPFYIKEQNIVELKGRIHLTTAAARRIYNQSANFNYAAALKAHTPSNDIEGQINEKMETMLLKMNEKIESITQIINAKMEQVTMLVEMFERLVESLLQNLTAINKLGGVTISPSRKKKSSQQSSQSIWYPNAIGCGFGCFWLGHFGAFFRWCSSFFLSFPFIREVFSISYIPEEWKHSIIVPVPKPNKDKSKMNSYRPIALTSIFSKFFERILLQRITHHLLIGKKVPPSVNGFLPLRDNQLAVYKIHTAITEAHSHKKYFLGISLDIKSTYDSDYIDGLILKCLRLGIYGNIKVLHSFLQNRTIQVRWRNSLSKTKTVQKSLPQGSVVSLILFACLLSDFFETLDVGVEYSIFADDIFIFCAHTSLRLYFKETAEYDGKCL